MNDCPFSRARAGLLFVAFISGAVCLGCELIWSRYLLLVFGVSVYAVATVLACFMLGLALGAGWLGQVADRSLRPLHWLAILQGVLGVWLLFSPVVYHGFSGLAGALIRALEPAGWQKHALRFFLALLVLVVPTSLIGATFPALVKSFAGSPERLGRDLALVYAVNTFGGAVGAFFTGFFLLPALGLSHTLALAAALSFASAGLLYALGRKPARPFSSTKEESLAAKSPRPTASLPASSAAFYLAWAVLAVSGFTSLAYEVIWTRLLTFFFKDSIYDLTIVLTAFLTGLAVGSLACACLLRRRADLWFLLGLAQVLIGASALTGLFLIQYYPYWINDLQTNTALVSRFGEDYWAAGNLIRFGYAFLLMLFPTILFGAAFPLAGRLCAEHATALGQRLGLLYGVSTLASALGSVFAGFVLISLWGVRDSLVLLALLNLVAALILLAASPRSKIWLLAGAAVSAGLLAALPPWDRLRQSTAFLAPDQPLAELLSPLFYQEDATGLTAVVELQPLHRKYLVSNRLFTHNDSALGGLEDHRRLGLIPLLLHPHPQSVLVVGLGAGITLRGVASLHPAAIECVELSPGVVAAARQFRAENAGVLDDPSVRITVEDGRNYLTTTSRKFDVIVLDIFFPFSASSGTAFSREYYDLCRRRLQPGGLVCQWLPVHQLSLADLKTIAATFQSVFANSTLWYGMMGDGVAVVGLVGSADPLALDYQNLATRLEPPALARELGEVNLQTPDLVLSHFIMGNDDLAAFSRGAPLDTDDRPVIEFSAPKLALQSRRLGLTNLLAINQLTHAVSPWLNPPAAPGSPLALGLRRQQIGKSEALSGLRFLLNNDAAGQSRFYQQALARDPANEDLRYALRAWVPAP